MNKRKLIGVFWAGPFVLASCGVAFEQAAPGGTQFPVSEAATWADTPDDGLNRLVLDLSDDAPPESAAPADGGATEAPSPSGALLGDQVHLYEDESGELWALLPSGERVAATLGPDGLTFEARAQPATATTTPSTTTTAAPTPADSGRPAIMADLRADPRVDAVIDLGDDTWSVVTTMTADELTDLTGNRVSLDVRMALSTNDPHFADQWALENVGNEGGVPDADVDFESAMQATDGAGIVVAVIDTGVDFSHADLLPNRWQNPGETSCTNGFDDDGNGFIDDCHGWDFADGDPTGYDPSTHWHGTHVAGTIAAAADNGVGVVGLAPGVQIMDVRVMGSAGTSSSVVAAAIRYAVDNGAQVLNLSLGTQPGAVPVAAVSVLADAIEYANLNGVVVVAAAGNDSTNIDNAPVWPASFPTANLVTVGSSTWYDSVSNFSNTGATSVDLFAPGSRILSTDAGGGYRIADGTSMATPHVVAAAALVLATDPDLGPDAVRARLMATADANNAFASRAVSGARLNASNAAWNGAVPATSLTFSGFTGLDPDRAFTGTISVEVLDADAYGGLDVSWEATLLTQIDGETFGVVDHPVTTTAGSTVTSPTTASFALSGALAPGADSTELALGTTLPEGDYALVVEAVPVADPSLSIGGPQVLFFAVGNPPEPASVPPGSTTTTTGPPPATTGPGTGGPPTSGASPTTTIPAGSPIAPPTDGGSPGPTPGATTTTTPAGGGATSPTQPPSSPIGGGAGSTPTTAPPSGGSPTTTPAPGPSTPAPGSAGGGTPSAPPPTSPTTPTTGSPTVEAGQWRIDSVSPSSGPLAGGGYITIDGSFPEPAFVWIGQQLANVLVVDSNELLVRVPGQNTAGSVDISLRTSADGEVLRAPGAYIYIGAGNPTITPTTTPPSGSTGSGSPAPTNPPPSGGSAGPTPPDTAPSAGTDGGGTDIGTPQPVATTTPAPPPDSPGPTTPEPNPGTGDGSGEAPAPFAPGAQSRLQFGFGEARSVGSLSLAPVTGGDPFASSGGATWAAARCSTEPCRPARP